MSTSPGRLFLIPNFCSRESTAETLPAIVAQTAGRLRIFIVEDAKSGRAFLRKLIPDFPLPSAEFFVFDEHTPVSQAEEFLNKNQTQDLGLFSESGLPCVADPGAAVVRHAHRLGMRVVGLPGPSSILQALAASGLNGQCFVFHGYLPQEQTARIKKLKQLEQLSRTENQTQIFMETPYRGQRLLDEMLQVLDARTLLCVACDLIGPADEVHTAAVREWVLKKFKLNDRPALFLVQKIFSP